MARQYLNLADVYGAVDQSRANQMQMENARMQQEQFRNQMARQTKQDQEADAIKGVYRGAIETDETGVPKLNEKRLLTELYGIAPEQALKTQEGFTKRDSEASKNKREEEKSAMEKRVANVNYIKSILPTVRDDASYQSLLKEANDIGATGFTQGAPASYDPNFIQSQLTNADKFLKDVTPDYQRVDLGGKIQIIDVNPKTNPSYANTNLTKTPTISELESKRHNRVSESNSAATLEETKRKNRLDGGQGKAPSGYRYTNDGNLQAIPGGPGDKAVNPTEGERKAATLLQRLEFSQKQLKDLSTNSPEAVSPSLLANGVESLGMEAAANTMRGSDRQQVEAAQLDVLDAALTLGTGAAYTREQLNGYRKSYFPQVGDSPATIKAKEERLENVIKAGRTQAGRAAPPLQTQDIIPKTAAMPKASGISVQAPNGKTYSFKSQAQANEFKRQAGIK